MTGGPFHYLLEKNSANDESATVVELYVRSGSSVREGDHILDIETSKAVQEIVSPWSGTITHELSVGDEPAFGSVLFSVQAEGAAPEEEPVAASVQEVEPAVAAPAPEVELAVVAGTTAATASRRVSAQAAALARELHVDLGTLQGRFVTSDDVRSAAAEGCKPGTDAAAYPVIAAHEAVSTDPPAAAFDRSSLSTGDSAGDVVVLTGKKRQEIRTLLEGAGASALSVLGALLGPIHRRPSRTASFFKESVLDLVAYEAARLMRKYPNLNAAFLGDGKAHHHSAVHAGVAFDDGNRLTVYAVPDADRLDMVEIQSSILDGLAKYVGNGLTSQDTTRATFTITDLSSMRVDFVQPLLPVGQACIIAIAKDPEAGYRLFVGFDHRISEGREAASFLGELCDRVRSYSIEPAREPECSFCGKTLQEERRVSGGRGLIRLRTEAREDALCCFACLSGG